MIALESPKGLHLKHARDIATARAALSEDPTAIVVVDDGSDEALADQRQLLLPPVLPHAKMLLRGYGTRGDFRRLLAPELGFGLREHQVPDRLSSPLLHATL